jgi:hypothetical protein
MSGLSKAVARGVDAATNADDSADRGRRLHAGGAGGSISADLCIPLIPGARWAKRAWWYTASTGPCEPQRRRGGRSVGAFASGLMMRWTMWLRTGRRLATPSSCSHVDAAAISSSAR